jgi:hypothetical protein
MRVKKALARAGFTVHRGIIVSPAGRAWMHNRSIQQIGGAR